MPHLTADQVLALAPDPASAAAGRGLASESNWVTSGMKDDAIWGEAKGSGKLPYQTAVDLGGIAYKCSCPSRKIPCKHALGLLLRYAQSQLREAEPPGWVAEWLGKRTEKAVKKAETPSTPNPEASAARAEKRWQTILDGLDECESFLEDAVTQGLIASTGVRSWDQMAARMIDAQAPGVALRLKIIGNQVGVGANWVEKAAKQMGSLSLLIQAAKSIDRLEKPLQADVRSALGISVRADELEGDPVIDVWDVLGQSVSIQERLTVYRSWMKGRGTGRWALQISYVAPGQMSTGLAIPGSALAGVVRYYESAFPLRVNIDEAEPLPFGPLPGSTSAFALNQAAAGWANCPWVESFPVHLSQACLGVQPDIWSATDANGEGLRLKGEEYDLLLAVSGNRPCELFGTWKDNALTLLGAWGEWGYVRL